MADMMEAEPFLTELEPEAARLLERHMAQAKEWFPHQLVPYSQGQDFEPDYEWSPADTTLSDEVRSALFVNLLTEDNLPYYFRTIDRMFGGDDAWGEWSRRWTAEEGRHSIVMRDYLTVTRSLDPVALERARMAQVSGGQVPEPTTPQEGFVYVALQELATRISHRNTGRLMDEPVGFEIMKHVAGDENRHHLFYRDLGTAALEVDPSGMVIAMERQVREFEMPGTGIEDFAAHARTIARVGIYDFEIHLNQILKPVIERVWKLRDLEGLSPEAEQAREALVVRMDRMGVVARRARRQKEAAKEAGHLVLLPEASAA